MPEIEIRPAISDDIPTLAAFDHTYTSDFVWQMDIQRSEEGQIQIGFREVRLPRSVRVDYPRSPGALLEDWQQRSGLLVALLGGEPVGYTSLMLGIAPAGPSRQGSLAVWMTDLVVKRRYRRQGIGSAMLLAAQEWGLQQATRHLVIELQPKNYPAIQLVQKLGFDLCGYNDRYFANHDIGLFFAKSLR